MTLRLALAQVSVQVGAIDANVDRILEAWQHAADLGAHVVVFTELTVTGYPPEDLLLKREFVRRNLAALDELAKRGPSGTVAIVGYVGAGTGDATDPDHWDVSLATRNLTNAAAVLADGAIAASYTKLRLPNYGVFDEARYFMPDDNPCVVSIAGVPVAVTICEDMWTEHGPMQDAAALGAQVLVSLNASPYHRGKRSDRERWVTHHARAANAWVAWCNVVGGQDEVVFDGDSMLSDPSGNIVARGAQFATDLVVYDIDMVAAEVTSVAAELAGYTGPDVALLPRDDAARLDPVAEVWHALVRSVADYCHRNGFRDAVVGLSGGIDSAVTAAIAVDALGADQVWGIAMPSPYSSAHSIDDAQALASALGCNYTCLPIAAMLEATGATLDRLVNQDFAAPTAAAGVAWENLQSRLRGVLVMALSNEHGAIVLTTGNKSEYAVGYATLYGDMAGGFAPLKDVPKLVVYELAHWRNSQGAVIPASTIDKPPSAELRPGQFDRDSLPDYAVLDALIEAYVERDLGIDAIVDLGYDRELVERTVQQIDRAEFKRRQAAPGPKITERAFGRDRRVPITNGWRG